MNSNYMNFISFICFILLLFSILSCEKAPKKDGKAPERSEYVANDEGEVYQGCFDQIPYFAFDKVNSTGNKITYYLRDNYEGKNFYLYDEVIFYAWSKGCFPKVMDSGSGVDSACFLVTHEQDTLVRCGAPEQFHFFSRLRASSQLYYVFFQKSLSRGSFRGDLSLLAHLYGKRIAKDPKDATIYHENVLLFLLKFASACEAGTPVEADKEILRSILHQLDSHKHVDTLIADLQIFQECL